MRCKRGVNAGRPQVAKAGGLTYASDFFAVVRGGREYAAGPWGNCSAACGPGVRRRVVACRAAAEPSRELDAGAVTQAIFSTPTPVNNTNAHTVRHARTHMHPHARTHASTHAHTLSHTHNPARPSAA